MKNLTTPKAVLIGFALIALSIIFIPYSPYIITPAVAQSMELNTISGGINNISGGINNLYDAITGISACRN